MSTLCVGAVGSFCWLMVLVIVASNLDYGNVWLFLLVPLELYAVEFGCGWLFLMASDFSCCGYKFILFCWWLVILLLVFWLLSFSVHLSLVGPFDLCLVVGCGGCGYCL